MTHSGYEAQVDALLDGELTADDARELEAHVNGCPDCARFRDERLALRVAIAAGASTFPAPDALRDRVRSALASAAGSARRPGRRTAPYFRWRPLAIAASLLVVAAGSWNLALRQAAREHLADEVLASHVRSLMPGHLTDVLSSDQHTVKPWFNGRVDFSPPVYDLAAQGYPLLGGRLDYVNGRSVATLVYGRRQHLINVFLWPALREPSSAPRGRDHQGYHLLHWTTPDYTYWIASDLGPAELREFARLLQQADSAAAVTSPQGGP